MRIVPEVRKIILCFLATASLGACNALNAPDRSDSSQHPESSYCGAAQAQSYSGATTAISGNAKFQYRALSLSGSCQGLCGDPVSLNIPFAEIHVVDSAGGIIQCAETDASGNFSNVQIPQTAGTYSVQVLSRANNAKVKVSVLEDIYSAAPYTVEQSITLTSGQASASVNLVASARATTSSKIPGAAFNILADIYWANEFLRAQTGNASFVADKSTVFWKAGFNPYSYFGSPGSLVSFYIASEDRLYILGGKNGDVKNSDTDHFDDSVVIHEYGHFLEAHYGHSDSPGGSHNGDFIIDPRLAWSEGWANYFQGAVLDKVVYAAGTGPKGTSGFSNYVDTIGFENDTVEGTGSSAGTAIKRSLTEAAATATYDRPATNEGVFREFSISRTLFKTLRASVPFLAVWQAFTSLNDVTTTFTPPHKFINFGLFNFNLDTKITDATLNTSWRTILSEEKQKLDTSLYGNTLAEQTPSPSCPTVTMNPVADSSSGGDRSNQLMSNDFYTFYHDGNAKAISFTYSTGGSGTNIVDLNLYLYNSAYNYSEEFEELTGGFSNSTMVRKSKTANVSSLTQTEAINLAGLPAGYYMINVKASTYNKSASFFNTSPVAYANYYLFKSDNGVTTCLVPN